MREALKFVAGSFAVYMVMGACSGKSARHDDGSSARAGHASGGSAVLAMNGGAPGTGGFAQAGDANGAGQMGSSGQTEGAGTTGGGEPHDAGVTDAMADPVPDAAAEEMSGTRLKARYYVGLDGSKQFAGFYDTSRKENCAVMNASDGTLRCLPTKFYAMGGSFYADDGCSQKLFVVAKAAAGAACPSTGSPSSPGYGYYADGCSYAYYTLTPTLPAVVYTGTPDACSGLPAPTSTYDFYTGTELDPATFEKMSDEVAQ